MGLVLASLAVASGPRAGAGPLGCPVAPMASASMSSCALKPRAGAAPCGIGFRPQGWCWTHWMCLWLSVVELVPASRAVTLPLSP